MAGIRVDGIDKTFGEVRALETVSLTVRDQEFVVLLGPSGCGKTTLLRIIAGLESANSGRVYIGERDATHLPPRARRISMVFQNYAVFPHLTVFENIAFGLRMKKERNEVVREKVESAATLMHIETLLQRYPAQLSGGQRQRVAVARALAVEPEVLLMDEPLSNLDALLRLEMRAELKRLLQSIKTTTLYVTHDQVEAMSMADRIAVMRNGRIAQYDVPIKIYQEPADTFVGGFIGSPPMNFLRLKLERQRDRTVAQVGNLALPGPTKREGEIILGLRPEDLEVSPQESTNSFAAEVLVVEPLGPHLLLTLSLNGQSLKVTAPPIYQPARGTASGSAPSPHVSAGWTRKAAKRSGPPANEHRQVATMAGEANLTFPPTTVPRALEAHLRFIYGGDVGEVLSDLTRLLEAFQARHPQLVSVAGEHLSELDTVLITYGDQVRRSGEAPLRTLHAFLCTHLREAVNTVHLLPFYPYTSDDGFSVVDYHKVDPALGDWEDIYALRQDFKLMFDAVINHVSAGSPWFQAFLRDEAPYCNYFITVPPGTDLSGVVRPRTTPLLTPFNTPSGTKYVWTTFSSDQIDLNFHTPAVLLEVLAVLLEYVVRGASILRLDAVTYLWKELGTSCVHHPKAHRALQLIRTVMDAVAPGTVLLTETNVPHAENVSYFGDGHNEAQMVYNFALPPLVLHSFLTGNAGTLCDWAEGLVTPSDETCFFNFLASHDGIGVRPVEGILTRAEITALAERVQAHGGRVSFKTNSDGSHSPYELNISYFDALSNPTADEPLDCQIDRFVAAHAIMLALAGVPGIYLHSLLGSRNDVAGMLRTGINRSINREKLDLDRLERELSNPQGLRARVLARLTQLLTARRSNPAFHPQARQEVLKAPSAVLALRRGDSVTCLVNVSGEVQQVSLDAPVNHDLLSAETFAPLHEVTLKPYGVRWLT